MSEKLNPILVNENFEESETWSNIWTDLDIEQQTLHNVKWQIRKYD
jgi:hypothetical protein